MPRKKLPQTRRARGTGSILFDKRRNEYVWKIPVGKYDNGRTRYREVRGKTHADCVEKGKNFTPPDPDAVTVGQWCARWLAGLTARPGTVAVYTRSMNNHVVPALGAVKLKELTVSKVKAAAQGWVGDRKDGKLAPQTVNLTLDRAETMFNAAVTDGLATTNPFALCPRLEFHRKPIDPFTPDELKQIIAARHTVHCGHLFAFLAWTGCRVGEGCALDVGDYDRATGQVRISKSYSPNTGMGPPKSKNSRRTITLPPAARAVVEEAIGDRTDGVLFRNSAGRRTTTNNVAAFFPKLLASLGLRRRTSHALRHSCATHLIAAGVPLGDVARHLGDAVNTIVSVYLHPSAFDVAGALGRILGE